jgi:hypothetical protein
MKGNNPNLLLEGIHSVENNKSPNEKDSRIDHDLMTKPIAIRKTNAIEAQTNPNINFLAYRSFPILDIIDAINNLQI